MSNVPLIIGHRGASAHAPENTIAAFRLALDAGADGFEFDVQLAKNGVPVVIHDATLERTGLRQEKVADLTSGELARTDAGSWFNAKFPRRSRESFAGQTVPLLDDVLELLADHNGLIYLELKYDIGKDHAPLSAAVCGRIKHLPLLPRLIVKSFNLAAVRLVKQQLPVVQTAALFEPEIRNVFKRRRHLVELARRHGADQLSVHSSLVTRGLMRAAQTASMPVTVWTVDDPRWIKRARALGVKALITNDPAKLLAIRDTLVGV